MIGVANKIVDRVIMCLTKNENYIDFWNYISKVYDTKFNTAATLVFSGTKEELKELTDSGRLSSCHGNIVHLPRVNGVQYDFNLDWTCTWGLFYAASLFPNDVCMLSGIDQIPLSSRFYDLLNEVDPRANYVVGFADAYGSDLKQIDYPSSHHVASGKSFKLVYSIEDSWDEELMKVYNSLDSYRHMLPSSFWGLDEKYSSSILRSHINNNTSSVPILMIGGFSQNWISRRIDRASGVMQINDAVLARIRNSEFTEYHSVRPFSANTKMDLVYDAIPTIENVFSY